MMQQMGEKRRERREKGSKKIVYNDLLDSLWYFSTLMRKVMAGDGQCKLVLSQTQENVSVRRREDEYSAQINK